MRVDLSEEEVSLIKNWCIWKEKEYKKELNMNSSDTLYNHNKKLIELSNNIFDKINKKGEQKLCK